jgi:hypothetical protein
MLKKIKRFLGRAAYRNRVMHPCGFCELTRNFLIRERVKRLKQARAKEALGMR